MGRGRPRTKPNLSFLRYLDILKRDQARWSAEERQFVETMTTIRNEFLTGSVPQRCGEGRPEALLLALESSRTVTEARGRDFELRPEHCVLPMWLVDNLRDLLIELMNRGSGERGKHSTDRQLQQWYIHYYRYSVVENLREEGFGLSNAFMEAAKRVPRSMRLGGPDAFKNSHTKVAKVIDEEPEPYLMALSLAITLRRYGGPENEE